MKTLMRILVTLRLKRAVFLLLIILAYSFSSFIPILFIQNLIDAVSLSSFDTALIRILTAGGLYIIFQFLSQYLYASYHYYGDKLQNEHAMNIRNTLFAHLLKANELKVKGNDYSQISNSIIEDTQYIADNYYRVLIVDIVAVINFIIGFIFMASINLYLALIIIPLGLLTSLCSKRIDRRTEQNLEQQKTLTEKTWKLFSEGVRGLKNIKIFDRQGFYQERIKSTATDLYRTNINQSKIENYGSCIVGALYMTTIALIMLFSAIFVYKGMLSFGGLLALVLYNHMLVDPLIDLIENRQKTKKLSISIARLEQVLSIEELDKERIDSTINVISFDNVSFSYDQLSVLHDFNARFEKNRKYCISGKTGTGKSTIVNLLTGYLTPDSGSIIVVSSEGKEYKNIIPERISYMIQGGFLFNTSIRDNIRFANPDIGEKQLGEIIRACCLEEVCERVSGNIGDDGNLLSGGERKRVQLAVCLAKPFSEVLIFDELSSSLDASTFRLILNNIQGFMKGKIVIFIEHYFVDKQDYDEVIKL